MANKPKNLRTMEVTTSSGKPVTSTSMLKGEAKQTAAERATNSTKQYETGKPTRGPGGLGGMPSGT